MKLFKIGLTLAPLVAAQAGFGGFTGIQLTEESTETETGIFSEKILSSH